VLWLGLMLAHAGYLTLPMTSVWEALKMISELQVAAVDLLILNPAWDGSPELMDTLRNRQGPLKVIQIESRDRDAADTDATHAEWIARVERALRPARLPDDVS
jgi:hypothetical protein